MADLVAAYWHFNSMCVCRHLPKDTERQIKIRNMHEISAAHFRTPFLFRGKLSFLESFQKAGPWFLPILDSYGKDIWSRINQWGAPVQDLGPREYATNTKITYIKGNRIQKSAMGVDNVLVPRMALNLFCGLTWAVFFYYVAWFNYASNLLLQPFDKICQCSNILQ